MPRPIWNIVNAAGLDADNMESIEKTEDNVKKIKEVVRQRWRDKIITDEEICEGKIVVNGAPDWIKDAIEEVRSAIQSKILLKKGEGRS